MTNALVELKLGCLIIGGCLLTLYMYVTIVRKRKRNALGVSEH
jgi:hypothetical protein